MIDQRIFISGAPWHERYLGYWKKISAILKHSKIAAVKCYILFLYYLRKKNKKKAKAFLEKHLFLCSKNPKHPCYLLFNHYQLKNISELKDIEEVSKEFLTYIKSSKDDYFPFDDLYLYFIHFGSFKVAAQLRKFSILEAKNYKGLNPINILLKINACIEERDFIQAQKEIEDHRHIKFLSTQLLLQKNFVNIVINKSSKISSGLVNEDFLKYINGKSIAIVGPVTPISEVGAEIDSFDIIIRPNFVVGQSHSEFLFGKRTDVSYYNWNAWKNRKSQIDEAASIEHLKWIVLRKINNISISELNNKSKTKYRLQITGKLMSYHGFFMKIPGIIFDVLFFNPKKIKVFGVSFYGTRDDYDLYYKNPINTQLQSWSLREHDGLSQFIFVKNLYQQNLVEFDQLGEDIIKMSLLSYSEVLNEKYGAYF